VNVVFVATKILDGVIARRALPDEAISRSEMRLPHSATLRSQQTLGSKEHCLGERMRHLAYKERMLGILRMLNETFAFGEGDKTANMAAKKT
jgi:hypothetical protein